MTFYGKEPTPADFSVGEQKDLEEEFNERAMENLKKMKDAGYLEKGEKGGNFLKENGYSENFGWKIVATILGFLFIGAIAFIGYCIYDDKIMFSASSNLVCSNQSCICEPANCDCGEITCQPAQVNITINPTIIGGGD